MNYIYPASETVNLLFGRILSLLATWSRSHMACPCLSLPGSAPRGSQHIGLSNWDSRCSHKILLQNAIQHGVRNLLPVQEMWETWVRSLGREDPLEEGMAPRSRILAWRIPCTEEPGRLQSMGSQRVRHTHTHTHTRARTHSKENLRFNIQLLK